MIVPAVLVVAVLVALLLTMTLADLTPDLLTEEDRRRVAPLH